TVQSGSSVSVDSTGISVTGLAGDGTIDLNAPFIFSPLSGAPLAASSVNITAPAGFGPPNVFLNLKTQMLSASIANNGNLTVTNIGALSITNIQPISGQINNVSITCNPDLS